MYRPSVDHRAQSLCPFAFRFPLPFPPRLRLLLRLPVPFPRWLHPRSWMRTLVKRIRSRSLLRFLSLLVPAAESPHQAETPQRNAAPEHVFSANCSGHRIAAARVRPRVDGGNEKWRFLTGSPEKDTREAPDLSL